MNQDERRLLDEKYGGLRNTHFENDCERLASGEPLGYVIGWQPFLGLKIFLDSRPLVPRPETEWWTEQLIAHVGTFNVPTLQFLDLCAGSGAIGCTVLARLPNARVFFGEIDPAHEATILKNIRENHLDESRAHIGIGDLFEPFADMKFDVIAANPPYIPTGRELPASVTDYEPALALRSGPDGLDLIRRIAASVRCHLTEQGVAWIECDETHTGAARALFEQQGLKVEVRPDQYGIPRIIIAWPI